jgi:hypothetical protein
MKNNMEFELTVGDAPPVIVEHISTGLVAIRQFGDVGEIPKVYTVTRTKYKNPNNETNYIDYDSEDALWTKDDNGHIRLYIKSPFVL